MASTAKLSAWSGGSFFKGGEAGQPATKPTSATPKNPRMTSPGRGFAQRREKNSFVFNGRYCGFPVFSQLFFVRNGEYQGVMSAIPWNREFLTFDRLSHGFFCCLS
jgi:hypothetical protein